MAKQTATDQYFIGIIPKGEVLDESLEYKHYFAEKYASKASLNSPPHITLHMPFRWKPKKRDLLHRTLDELSKQHQHFDLRTKNFSCFPPRTIFIDIEENSKLIELQSNLEKAFKLNLKLLNANYRNHAFKPHITLAFRDLKKDQFVKAWKEFEGLSYRKLFSVNQLTLFKHDGKRWQCDCSFNLNLS
jgi:2'-5' RNA ligase